MNSIDVLLVDKSRLFREGLKQMLPEARFNIIDEVANLPEAAADLETMAGQVRLVIYGLSAYTAAEFSVIKWMTNQFPEIKVILLTDREECHFLDMAIECGVCGLLSKNISSEALLYSLELILLGEKIFPSSLSALRDQMTVTHRRPEAPESNDHRYALSSRERQILASLATGGSNKLIARQLNIKEPTVKAHLKALLRKLNATNRTQAAIYALRNPSIFLPAHQVPVDMPKEWPVASFAGDTPSTGTSEADDR